MAQHYEMRTDLLDLTSDIMVAAFFATNKYESKDETYRPIKEGIGCLRMRPNLSIIINVRLVIVNHYILK